MRSMTPIGPTQISLEDIRRKLETTTFNSIRGLLTDRMIEEACRSAGVVYRQRLITPKVTVLHMLLAALWPEASFAAGWQVLWDSMTSRLPEAAGRSPNSGSVAKARGRLPMSLWDELFRQLSQTAQDLAAQISRWRGLRPVLMDGTCVSMPDERALRRAFGTCSGVNGRWKYPIARVVTVALAQSMTVLSYSLGRYRQSENELAAPLLRKLGPGDLLLADRRFAGAAMYARYRAQGLEFLTRMHHLLKVSRLRRVVSYGKDDFVTDLVMNPAYRRADPQLPATVRVRVLRARVTVRGKREVLWLVTSLLDGKRYPADEIVDLYGKRWRIEELFGQVKVRMSADVLRSRTVAGVHKELAARMMAVNLVRMVTLQAACRHGTDPLRISFVHATRAIIAYAPTMATASPARLPEIYAGMLEEIASQVVPCRPGRNEPRAVRREPRQYPSLRITRRLWRLRHAA